MIPDAVDNYLKVMRSTPTDEEARTFRGRRWCFRDSIGRWIALWTSGSEGRLPGLVEKSCPHIGGGSFFELT